MAHQSLYRRYRSQRFSELRGQDHVTSALQSAVEGGRYGHAYLFSGPRGTGKTSTARILAKALNCPNVSEGEPCCECDSCIAIEQGRSFDLHELDAASHNKVDDIRDLISRVNLGSPGRTKVYILDEVHMLSAGAENALLKTLEEPPEHVVFVLATTEPHKVVDTILSRTQHFEFHLLPADVLAEHVRFVIEDAGLDVGDDAIDYVLRQGGGSARDTLSALDLVAAAGGVPAGSDIGVELAEAIGSRDPGTAMAAVQGALTHGQEPRVIGEETLEVLRNSFLAAMGTDLSHLSEHSRSKSSELASSLGPATLTNGLEALGQALVEMRQAPDPRIPLEVTLLRLTRSPGSSQPATPAPPAESGSGSASQANLADAGLVAELQQRIASLEATVADLQAAGTAPTAAVAPTASVATAAPRSAPAKAAPAGAATRTEEAAPSGPAAMARSRLRDMTGKGAGTAPAAKPSATPASPAPASPSPTAAPQSDESTAATQPDSEAVPVPAAPTEAAPAEAAPQAAAEAAPPAPAAPVTHPGGPTPTVAQASAAVTDSLDVVAQRVRVRFNAGNVQGVNATDSGAEVVVAVPNAIHRDRCDDVKGELEQALSERLGVPTTVAVVVDTAPPPTSLDPIRVDPKPRPTANAIEDVGPIEDLEDATDQSATGVDRLTDAFPGSRVIDGEPQNP